MVLDKELMKWHAKCGNYCKMCLWSSNCNGCREQEGRCYNLPLCKTYECVTSKGYDFCFECEDFPCEMLQPLVHFKPFIPHNAKLYNLIMIKKLGLEEWNKICDEKVTLYYKGRKVRYGGDPLILEKKHKS